jgi:hypothetical protein
MAHPWTASVALDPWAAEPPDVSYELRVRIDHRLGTVMLLPHDKGPSAPPKLAYLMLRRSIRLLSLLARGDAAKDLRSWCQPPGVVAGGDQQRGRAVRADAQLNRPGIVPDPWVHTPAVTGGRSVTA